MPLVLPVMGAQGLPRAAKVRVRLGDIDLITLDVNGTVIERLDAPQPESSDASPDDADGEAEDDDEVAGPIAIAVDVSDSPEPSGDNPA
jgi:exoribonuclease-2